MFRNMADQTSANRLTVDGCHPVNTSVHAFFILIYSLVFLVGLLLNSYTMKFYFCRAHHRVSSSLTVYLKNLTAADFLLCLSLPIRITNYASSSTTIHQLHCSIGIPVLYFNMYASILFMGYIAANRYLKIIHPSGTHMLQTVRAAKILSGITWACLLAPTISFITTFFITQKPQISDLRHCDSVFSASASLLGKGIHTCLGIIFLVVLISLVFFYYNTSRRVLLAQQRQFSSSNSKKLVKSRKNMLLLVCVFCVCFIPYHLVRLPYIFLLNSHSLVSVVLFYLNEVTIMISVFNVCLDPLIYCFLCKAFRAQVNLRMPSRFAQINIQPVNKERKSSEEQLDTLTPVTMIQTSEL
ncbi:P2Y purinoceptor 14 isoform X2 [Oreochromis niloticus]|uniref:P2Y purinoceptor 14 isoform X2 n=1 Tax=Oreochromis niloticus TaxID=8128 RepID=UPI00025FC2F5|nr:P2Y purinoceptor 14 isoform X2 [Oreochromis niloticus]